MPPALSDLKSLHILFSVQQGALKKSYIGNSGISQRVQGVAPALGYRLPGGGELLAPALEAVMQVAW